MVLKRLFVFFSAQRVCASDALRNLPFSALRFKVQLKRSSRLLAVYLWLRRWITIIFLCCQSINPVVLVVPPTSINVSNPRGALVLFSSTINQSGHRPRSRKPQKLNLLLDTSERGNRRMGVKWRLLLWLLLWLPSEACLL